MWFIKNCSCSSIFMSLSFFLKFFNLQPHRHLIQLNFSVSLLKIPHNTHLSSKISRTFKPNQAPNVASSFVLIHWYTKCQKHLYKMPPLTLTESWLNLSRNSKASSWHLFQFPKSSSYIWNLCVKNDTYIELNPITRILKISISLLI